MRFCIAYALAIGHDGDEAEVAAAMKERGGERRGAGCKREKRKSVEESSRSRSRHSSGK